MALLGLPVLGSATASASCASDAGPAGAPVIFVGVAEEERRGFTRFAVTEVWAGPDLAADVWVRSSKAGTSWPGSMFSGTSTGDASFTGGEGYVVGASTDFVTSDCSIASERSAAARNLRPEDARAPVPGASEGLEPPLHPLVLGFGVLGFLSVLVALVVLLLARHRARIR